MTTSNKIPETTITRNTSYEGESLEKKINRIINNKEPIKDGAPIIYTDRKDGVRPEYDVRTDRFELAVEGMGVVAQTKYNERQQRIGERTYDTMTDEQKQNFHKQFPNNKFKNDQTKTDSGAEPTQAT